MCQWAYPFDPRAGTGRPPGGAGPTGRRNTGSPSADWRAFCEACAEKWLDKVFAIEHERDYLYDELPRWKPSDICILTPKCNAS